MAQRLAGSDPSAPVFPGVTERSKLYPEVLLTFQVLRVVDDEIPIPHHGEVHGQVADVHPVVLVLQGEGRRAQAREAPYHRGSGMLLASRGARTTAGEKPGSLAPSGLIKEQRENQENPICCSS